MSQQKVFHLILLIQNEDKNQLPVPTCTEVNYQVQVAVRIGVYVEAINQLKELSIVFNAEKHPT